MVWTRFMDMHSGGDLKTTYNFIFIEADVEQAKRLFEEKFGRNPDNVTCSCCGPDFSVYVEESLGQATAFERKCDFVKEKNSYDESTGQSLEDFKKRSDVCIIFKDGGCMKTEKQVIQRIKGIELALEKHIDSQDETHIRLDAGKKTLMWVLGQLDYED